MEQHKGWNSHGGVEIKGAEKSCLSRYWHQKKYLYNHCCSKGLTKAFLYLKHNCICIPLLVSEWVALTSASSNYSSVFSLPVFFNKCHCMTSCEASALSDSQQGVTEAEGEWQQDQSHSTIVIFYKQLWSIWICNILQLHVKFSDVFQSN